MVTGPMPMCFECKRHFGDLTCDAFPDGIPQEIVLSEHDHRKPFVGDDGFRFLQDEALRGNSGSPILAGTPPNGVKAPRP